MSAHVLAFLTLILAISGQAAARPARRGITSLNPAWAKHNPSEVELNASFLNDTKKIYLNPDWQVLSGNALDSNMQLEANALFRDYETRRRYGLVDQMAERNFISQAQDLGNRARNAVYDDVKREGSTKAHDVTERNPTLKTMVRVATPIAIVGGAVSGQPVPIQLNPQSKLTVSANVAAQNAQFAWDSPLMNGSFNYDQTCPISPDFSVPPPADPSQHRERYRLSISKQLAGLGVNSGISYGSTSGSVSASLSKPINDHLTASMVTLHTPLDPSTSDYKTAEEIFRLDYSLRF